MMENNTASSDTLRSFADSDITAGIDNANADTETSRAEKKERGSLKRSFRERRNTLTEWVASTSLGQRAQGITLKQMKRVMLATISRIFLTIHGTVLIWVLVELKCNPEYWLLLVGLFGVYIEMCITLNVTDKGEWKWFSPSVFMYLCVALPCIFLSELDLQHSSDGRCNSTVSPHILASEDHEDKRKGTNSYQQGYSMGTYREWLDAMEQLMILVLIVGRWIMPKGQMTRDQLAQLLLLYIGLGADILLIVGRWIMPKGQMTRDQLAQLLLLYIGLGADILDILQFLKDNQINRMSIMITGLSIYSWVTLQFTLVLTQTQSSRPQVKGHGKDKVSSCSPRKRCNYSFCVGEVWSLAISVAMQD
uniref:Transmembrane protein 26 n=1 Tax=Leptobrachium leishanense TaxID=445787 RepID=A0A8C5MY36_9ANUR